MSSADSEKRRRDEANLNRFLKEVRTVWERQRIPNPSAATEADIVAFEQKYNVTLAPIVREYFHELNGTKTGELGMDDECLLGFWHLDQVRPVKEECPKYATADEPNLFMFADYSIWALGYAIRLAPANDAATAIFLLGGNKPVKLAPTLEEFLNRYAVGDQTVLFGSNEPAEF